MLKFKNLIKLIILLGSIYILFNNIELTKLAEIFVNTKNILYLILPLIFVILQIFFGLIKHVVLVNYRQQNKISFSQLLLPTLLSYLVDQISIIGYFIIKLVLLKNLNIKFGQIIFASFFDKFTSFLIKFLFALPFLVLIFLNNRFLQNNFIFIMLILGFIIVISFILRMHMLHGVLGGNAVSLELLIALVALLP